MSLTREERKLLHQKSQQPTFGSGKPNDDEGFNGDISYRKVEGSGTVQYLKENNSWTAISSSGEMPPIRIAGGGGGGGGSSSSGVTSHNDLTSLSTDDHVQYLLIDGSRAMTGGLEGTTFDATTDFTVGTTVITDDSIVMTPTSGDTFTLASTTNGATSLTTVDTAGAAGHLTVVVDGNVDIDGLVVTLDAVTSIELEGATNITGALTTTSTATVGTDLTVTGGDIYIGAVATSAFIVAVDSAASTAGNLLSIGGSDVTAGGGGTANVQGGSVVIKAGTSTGTAASGSIIFQTAPAGGASGTSASNASLASVLTIAGDASSTFTGAIIGTTIDASTDFTIDGLVITADTISNDADLTIDGAADIILSADGDQIKMDDGSTTRFVFNVDSTPEIDVTGAFTIDGSSTIRLDSVSTMDFYVNGREKLKFDTSGHAYFHAYSQTLFNDYPINILASNNHLTSGEADFQQNYSWLGEHSVSSAYNTDFGT